MYFVSWNSEPKARADVLRHASKNAKTFPFGELEEDDDGSKLLEAFSKCTMQYIPSTMNVDGQVASRSSMRAIQFKYIIGSIGVGSNMILVREFYEELLKKIRSYRVCVLIGNPGIGKSVYHFYCLARMLNPTLFGPLPADHKNCTDAPKVVIRQVGATMTIYDIEKRVAYRELPADPRILKYFNPAVTLYLFEPAGTKNMEPYYDDIRCPILATVSPDTSRYKEICKNGGLRLYMPIYERQQLLDVGSYLLDQKTLPESLRADNVYSPKNISDRYGIFGGIIRHVLPATSGKLLQAEAARRDALYESNAEKLLSTKSIEDNKVSHMLKQMIVARSQDGSYDFTSFHTEIVNESIVQELGNKISEVGLKMKIQALMRNDKFNVPDPGLSIVYEVVLTELLTSREGSKWAVRKSATSNKYVDCSENDWKCYEMNLLRVERDIIPQFDNMDYRVLYYPRDSNYPAVDFFFKSNISGIDRLSAFQVTRQQEPNKEIKLSAYRKFLGNVGQKDSSLIQLYVVPRPRLANNSFIVFTTEEGEEGEKKQSNLTKKELDAQVTLYEKTFKKLEKAEKMKEDKKKPWTANQQKTLVNLKEEVANILKEVEALQQVQSEEPLLRELSNLKISETYTIKVPEKYES